MDQLLRNKKIILIAGFFIFIIICGYALYALFFRPNITTNNPDGTNLASSTGKLPQNIIGQGQVASSSNAGNLSTTETNNASSSDAQEQPISTANNTANGGLTKVIDINNVPSLGMTLGNNGEDIQYYNKNDNKFYRVDKNGKISLLSDKEFFSVDKITWSPDKNKAVLEYPDNTKVVYDFSTKKQTTLAAHWKDFDFSSDSSKLVMKSMGTDPDNRWLAVVDANGSSAKKIEPLGDEDSTVRPMWSPNSQVVALFTQGIDFERQEVYFIGQNSENFKSTIINGRDFRPKWSPKGDKLIYSVYSGDNNLKPMLWVVNSDGEKIGTDRQKIGISTWADKCTFADDKTIYCAVPKDLPDNAGMFPDLAKTSIDDLYKIDIYTGAKKLVAIPDGNYNISSLVVSQDNDALYFTDNNNQNVHKINLK